MPVEWDFEAGVENRLYFNKKAKYSPFLGLRSNLIYMRFWHSNRCGMTLRCFYDIVGGGGGRGTSVMISGALRDSTRAPGGSAES